MKYGDYETPPLHYVRLQRLMNSTHTDGKPVNKDDLRAADELAEMVAEHWVENGKILVVGCRLGVEMMALQENLLGAYVAGVDIVPDFVEYAKDCGLNAQVADMHALPFEDKEFDWVLCVGTLEHAYNVERASRELQRVCKDWLYVTADLENEEDSKNPSNFAFSPDPEEWRALFAYFDLMEAKEEGNGICFLFRRPS